MNLFLSSLRMLVLVAVQWFGPTHEATSTEPWKAPAWTDTLNREQLNDPAWIALGRSIYANECLICHGSAGRGDGESGFGLHIPPGDFCAPDVISETNGALYYKISVGRKPMPSYENKLSENARWQLVAYIRELQRKYLKNSKKKSK